MVVNCEQVWREVSNYIDGEVDAGLRTAMDAHFATCAHCKSVLEGTRNVVALYGDERMMEVPAGFSHRLQKKLTQPAAREKAGWSVWSAWLVPVAALVLIAGGLELAKSRTLPAPVLQSEHAQPGHDIPPDMQVVVTAGTKLFHLAGCGVIHNRDKIRTLTAKEAIQEGYAPCTRCLRKYVDVASLSGPGGVSTANIDFDGDEEEPHGHGD